MGLPHSAHGGQLAPARRAGGSPPMRCRVPTSSDAHLNFGKARASSLIGSGTSLNGGTFLIAISRVSVWHDRKVIDPELVEQLPAELIDLRQRRIQVLVDELRPPRVPTSGHVAEAAAVNAFQVRRFMSKLDRKLVDVEALLRKPFAELPGKYVVFGNIRRIR